MTKNIFCNEQLYNDDRVVFNDVKQISDKLRLKHIEAVNGKNV